MHWDQVLRVNNSKTERLDGNVTQAVVFPSFGAYGSLVGSEEASLDTPRTQQTILQVQQKILKLTEQLRIEQAAQDVIVAEYLKLAGNASDKQQSIRIKQVFEKKNWKIAASIAQLQRKIEHYHRHLHDAEHSSIQRQPKDVLREMQQGLRDVITSLSEGVVDSVKGGLSSFSLATHSSTGTVASKPCEMVSLIRNKFGSADNIKFLKNGMEDGEDSITTRGCSLGSSGGHLQSSPKFGSDEDCSSSTSGSVGANSITEGPGGPRSSRGNSLERGHSGSLDMLMQEVQDLHDAQARLEDTMKNLKGNYLKECTLMMQALREERFRCEHLEEQLHDLTELHQNEILNLKQELASMEEKIAYQSNERACDLQEALEACQTRIFKMELQQVVQLEGFENATARTLLGKLINVLLGLIAVLLVFVSTIANCIIPLMKTQLRCVSLLLLFLLFAVLWRN